MENLSHLEHNRHNARITFSIAQLLFVIAGILCPIMAYATFADPLFFSAALDIRIASIVVMAATYFFWKMAKKKHALAVQVLVQHYQEHP